MFWLLVLFWVWVCIFCVTGLSGCAHQTTPEERDEAVRLLWRDAAGMPYDVPPISWRTQEHLGCGANGHGWIAPHTAQGENVCVVGLTHFPAYRLYGADGVFVEVAWWSDYLLPSQSSLAHELIGHVLDYVRGGDGDPLHQGPAFQPGGAVDQAQELLRSRGL